jgi:hypothetical protein
VGCRPLVIMSLRNSCSRGDSAIRTQRGQYAVRVLRSSRLQPWREVTANETKPISPRHRPKIQPDSPSAFLGAKASAFAALDLES